MFLLQEIPQYLLFRQASQRLHPNWVDTIWAVYFIWIYTTIRIPATPPFHRLFLNTRTKCNETSLSPIYNPSFQALASARSQADRHGGLILSSGTAGMFGPWRGTKKMANAQRLTGKSWGRKLSVDRAGARFGISPYHPMYDMFTYMNGLFLWYM